MNTQDPITIRELYPDFTEEQLEQAEATFRRYIAVMTRIYTRVREEQGHEAATALALGNLTVSESSSTIPNERSNPLKNQSTTQ
jgi:hypothetical protein